jgi:menaquinone-dependent protoporphyrinogen oxidase
LFSHEVSFRVATASTGVGRDVDVTSTPPIDGGPMRVLIAYASAHGSTAGMARFVGDVLRSRGLETVVADSASLASVDGYDACIVGSAVHHGLWLPEMAAFVRRCGAALSGKPTFLWLACVRPLEQGGFAYVTDNYLPNLLPRKLTFRRIAIFAGELDAARLDPQDTWTLAFRYDGPTAPIRLLGDHRDWPAIRAWAEQVADDLGAGSAP